VTIIFYISGHGFGHASRQIEVIDTLLEHRPDIHVVVRTAVPARLFEIGLAGSVELQRTATDSGVAQLDSLRIDEEETAWRAARFYADFDDRVRDEAAVLGSLDAALVVGDIPPLAFAAADRAGVPSLAIANFTWDWIYPAFEGFERLAPGVTERIAAAYSRASAALRLPMAGGFATMANVRDVPFIARRSRYSRAEARDHLGLKGHEHVVLASFGGHHLEIPYDEVANRNEFVLVVTDHEAPRYTSETGRLRHFDMRELASRDLRYQDLVAAADVVVTKPGYGIVSECVANQTALAYTSRGRFPEYDVMVAEMPRVLRCRQMSQDELLSARWDDTIQALLKQPAPPVKARIDGASVAVAEILSRL